MRALVTGAGGFVGPHLVAELTSAGDDVVALDQTNGPDLLDGEGWCRALSDHRPDVVYHLAGWSDVSGSWRNPTTTFRVNAEGTLSVLEAARAAGTERVLVVSSADVYGIVDADTQPITEAHPVQPRSPYGASKQAAEALGLQYHRGHGLDVIVVRPFNHLGVGQRPNFAASAFAAQIAEAERAGGGTVAHGDLSARRDLTDVRDVVAAYRMLAVDGEGGEVYNVCSGVTVSMQYVLDGLVKRSEVDIATEIDPSRLRPVELPVLCGSSEKLHDRTGWEPRHDLDQTLTDVLTDARNRAMR
jgi:GDP-4-dehydro-6-deoxy-D-mannose reductase